MNQPISEEKCIIIHALITNAPVQLNAITQFNSKLYI